MPEKTTLSSRITSNDDGISLVDFLCSRFKYHDRDRWTGIILEGSVTVNGAAAKPERVLKKNDVVSYAVELREPPVDTGITILHEEDSFLVAGKPGNLPSHADGNFIKNTFIYILRRRMGDAGHNGPVKLVHRLDRETSGIMVVGKTDSAHRVLVKQFEEGTVEKEYRAVVRGTVADDAFEVGGAIGPDGGSAVSIRRKVVPEGTPGSRPAFTRFEVIERYAGATLLRCLPATGRTNQIRVHLDHAGHPLAGDKLYGRSDEQFLEFVRRARRGIFEPLPWMEAPRHLLHAYRLGFRHPVTGERVSFECPMPDDMKLFIDKNRQE
ncbi:MAG TPA: RluA family pseudouridine synthase [Spirochaetota bacterium]|nr:RluA family pseudouridine synthase [Spirochaetota bacterium]HQF08925.1 RluA family pseudouridine synthase [Spirochaetota bacterium]HQH97851.1 RluA family pseudouridine synthase [Spirochaetota bacterium]HQJ71517.1 RluA family pseudouridine synthase [Spirochaetota bacterium]HRS78382.1 RluA family pseudouridine synthase [Spirochaetota bacterium]